MEIECVGQVFEKGKIAIDPALLSAMKVGAKIRLRITIPEKKHKRKVPKDLSPAAKQFIEMLDNSRPIGVPDDPQEISHSRLAEERMEEKFPSRVEYESDISEALLTIAEQDWKDWANSKEDIYEEYRQYAEKG